MDSLVRWLTAVVVYDAYASIMTMKCNSACARFLEAAFWSLERDGERVSDFIEESIIWREKIGADRLRKEDVLDQGNKGAIVVKGHDRNR